MVVEDLREKRLTATPMCRYELKITVCGHHRKHGVATGIQMLDNEFRGRCNIVYTDSSYQKLQLFDTQKQAG